MLAYFPKAYQDEDFRSIIYRYHIRSGKLSFDETNKELFNIQSQRNVYFHHNIGEMIRLLNQKDYTIEYFLYNHTIFPIIKPFFPDQRIQDYVQSLRIEASLNKKIFQEYVAKDIKYCPECLKIDYEKYGEVYSHRFHQLYFLNHCHIHQVELICTCSECGIPLSNSKGMELLTRPKCKNGHCLISTETLTTDCPQLIKNFIQDIYLITSITNKVNRNYIIELFYSKLGKLGYGAIHSPTIQIERLKNEFSNFVSNHHEMLVIQKERIIDTHFNLLLSKKSNLAPNIIAYLLLIQFVSNSFKEFISNAEGYSIDIPFENKQFPCRNKICEFYNHKVIKTYTKKYHPVYVTGTFMCPVCGYTYGHTWNWNKDKISGKVNSPFLINRGDLWEKEVIRLYYQGLHMKDIAYKTGLGTNSDPIEKFLKDNLGIEYEERFNVNTVKTLNIIHSRIQTGTPDYYHALKEIEMGMKEVAATNFDYQLLLLRRQNIINIINDNPSLHRKGIEEIARADYRWLKKNDTDWFNEVLPIPLKNGSKSERAKLLK